MEIDLNQGWRLIRQKQYSEAEAFFKKAASKASQRAEALNALAKIAQVRRNFDLKLEYLDELAILTPENLNARLMRAHLRGLRGNTVQYKQEVAKIMEELSMAPFQPKPVFRKLLRGIQFLFSNGEKVQYMLKLLELINQSIGKHSAPPGQTRLFKAELLLALGDVDQMVSEIAAITKEYQGLPGLGGLKKVAKKAQSPQYPDYNAPKIFGIGLSRTGTSSLDQAFRLLGFHSVHWTNPFTQTIVGNQDFVLFDAFSDISVSYQFEKLYHTFPNARFVLTTRELSSWVKSITNHYRNKSGFDSPSALTQSNRENRYEGVVKEMEWGLYGQNKSWEESYLQHYRRVYHFFSNKPEGRLLELNICGGEGWSKLCPFLDKPVPDFPFPNKNKGRVYSS
jgi:hypothetical protein